EPFFTTKDVGEGTGLGLAVSRQIIEEHGGWIEVANQAESGAAFTIYLPLAESAAVTALGME
ncbi:MAG: two-component sensor histidine kinase, partial [Blastocatellia bacterium]|nr:two-component sensor histidine kinase [Blastocatellia bacterium]